MVKISDVLEQRQSDSSPCVAHVSNHRSITKVLTYRDAWLVLKEHQSWLERLLPPLSEDTVIAYLSSNSTDMMISLLAAANQKAKVALLNTRWTSSEMAAVLQSATGSTIILYSNELRGKAFETKTKLQHAAVLVEIPYLADPYLTESWSTSSHEESPTNESIDKQIQTASSAPSSDDDALLVFTSGTTSGSKGVRLSHRALLVQALAKLRDPCRYNRTTRMLSTTVPLFHVGGLSSTLAVWLAGGTLMVPAADGIKSGFDPSIVLDMISHPHVPTNTLVVVPAMLHALIQIVQQREQVVYPQAELILIGGQSASQDMIDNLGKIFPRARLVQTYACTEAASSMTFHEPTIFLPEPPIAGDCVGLPPPHVQLQLVERTDSTTIITEPYTVGILATSGPHVMTGYWKRNCSSTKNQQQPKSCFVTNDLGFRDPQGLFYFCGRSKDVIRTGGETVIALEVERVLLQHDSIDECAVFGLPDVKFGETVCAAIVSSRQLSLDNIRQHHCHGLASYKRPRRLFAMSELPRNSSGKVLKFQLVQQFQTPISKL